MEKKEKFDRPPRLGYVLGDRMKPLPNLPPFDNRMKGRLAFSAKRTEVSVESARERAKRIKAKKIAKEQSEKKLKEVERKEEVRIRNNAMEKAIHMLKDPDFIALMKKRTRREND